MEILEKIIQILNRMFLWVAGLFMVAMILITCANIFLRIVWVPLRGTFELMGFFGAVATAFVLGYTQMKKAHISVDILFNQFSQSTRKVFNAINHAVCMLFFAVVGWQIFLLAANLRNTGEVTETLRIVYYPFTYGVAFGCMLLALVLLLDFVKLFSTSDGER
ncbi:MAG: TRAP transporter small permease subunit [Desulfobacterales bacterium]|jgi:TRAP-type C4-dicarboxylate transport system permease small subunit